MSETFSVTEAVQLAVVERSGFVESRHSGSALVLSADGTVLRSLGNPLAAVFPRSSLKPFQAIAVMNSGVPLDGVAAVLAAASHMGTSAHLSVVRALLRQAGLDESTLLCPASWPRDEASRNQVIAAGGTKHPLYMECSGKHAAMLLACVQNGWSIAGYLETEHPVQLLVRDVIERLTGEKVVETGVDGCGLPVFAMSLAALAKGFQRIATASERSPFALYRNCAALRTAVLENPWAIEGPGRPNTVAIERFGVFAKTGAEGVLAMSAPDGTTVALKMMDGGARAVTIVGLRLLADAGAIDPTEVTRSETALRLAVHGGDAVVGSIRAAYATSSL